MLLAYVPAGNEQVQDAVFQSTETADREQWQAKLSKTADLSNVLGGLGDQVRLNTRTEQAQHSTTVSCRDGLDQSDELLRGGSKDQIRTSTLCKCPRHGRSQADCGACAVGGSDGAKRGVGRSTARCQHVQHHGVAHARPISHSCTHLQYHCGVAGLNCVALTRSLRCGVHRRTSRRRTSCSSSRRTSSSSGPR